MFSKLNYINVLVWKLLKFSKVFQNKVFFENLSLTSAGALLGKALQTDPSKARQDIYSPLY